MTKYLFVAALMLGINVYAWPSISNVEVIPLSPWGGVASYSVTGSLPDNASSYSAWVVISDTTTAVAVEANITKGDRSLTLGEHQLWWNGPALKLDDYTVRIKYDPLCSRGEISHNYVRGSTEAATCSTPQTTTYTCSVCGQTKKETSGSALGHILVAKETGYWGGTLHYTYYQCSRCGYSKYKYDY